MLSVNFWMAEYFCNWLSYVQGDMSSALLLHSLLRLFPHR